MTEVTCRHCGEDIRPLACGEWWDRETHATGEDGHRHEPATPDPAVATPLEVGKADPSRENL